MDQNIKIELGKDGVLLACIDMQRRSMNVFSMDMMDSLERLIVHVEEDPAVRAVVVTSGKSAFIAGADLAMVKMFTERARTDSHSELVGLCGRLGRIFRRLEKSPKPWVAAVNGLALGGGLELCLACHARVAVDGLGLMLGLPEIKLGLLPGAGGTQRLPRLVGAPLGLRMLLQGDPLKPAQALSCGLVDEVVSADALLDTARRKALAMADSPLIAMQPWDRTGSSFDDGELALPAPGAHQRIAAALGLSDDLIEKYPAYTAIMNCVIDGWEIPVDAALDHEMDIFVGLIQNPVAGNMIRSLFLNRQRSLKAAPISLDPRTAKVAVIGEGGEAVAGRLSLGRAKVVGPDELGAGDVAVRLNGAKAPAGTEVVWLADGAVLSDAGAGVWAAPKSEYGRAVEVVVESDDAAARDAALAVVRWLGADAVLVSRGTTSYLESLSKVREAARAAGCSEEEQLLAVSLAAIRTWLDKGVEDIELADSSAVVAGIAPAYSGGPFCCALQHGPESLRAWAEKAQARDAALFAWPEGAASLFAQAG